MLSPVRFFIQWLFLAGSFAARAQPDSAYQRSLNHWYEERYHALKAENGWLNLAGLFWLKPGANTFGSGKDNAIVYAQPAMPQKAGTFFLDGGKVVWVSEKGVSVTTGGRPADSLLVHDGASLSGPQLGLGSFRWNIIRREDRYGIRFRDLQYPALVNFHGTERYPADTTLRFRARLVQKDKLISFQNKIGQTLEKTSPGTLAFGYNGKAYTLDVLYVEPEGWLIVFGDPTSGEETYEGGRFVYVEPPGADGCTTLDFNKAINPPCAFTPFATCPLPPPQNVLPFAVRAGERKYRKE